MTDRPRPGWPWSAERALVLIALLSCSPAAKVAAPQVRITSLSASTVQVGEPLTIAWTSSAAGAYSVELHGSDIVRVIDRGEVSSGADMASPISSDVPGVYDVWIVVRGAANVGKANAAVLVVGPAGTTGVSSHTGAVGPAPRLFFTDVTSGPAQGGEDNQGTYVTLFGLGFGSTRGSGQVTFDGVEVARYVSWGAPARARGLETIVVQLGAAIGPGDKQIIVTQNGAQSAALPFKVRSGALYYVAPDGSDAAPGTFAAPVQTLAKARALAAPGDTVIVRAGTYTAADPSCTAPVWLCLKAMSGAGTADAPIAYVGYPGEAAIIDGGPSAFQAGVDMSSAAPRDYVVLANLRFTNISRTAISLRGTGHRVVNVGIDHCATDIPRYLAAMKVEAVSALTLLGVLFDTNSGATGNAALEVNGDTTTVSGVDIGFSDFRSHLGSHGVSLVCFPSCTGSIDGVRVHHTLITSPAKSPVNVYGIRATAITNLTLENDVLSGGGEAGMSVDAADAVISVRHVTFHANAGAQLEVLKTGTAAITFDDNLLFSTGGAGYVSLQTATPAVFASMDHDLFFGSGAAPTFATGALNADPMFGDRLAGDFSLSAGSPAVGAAAASAVTDDYFGNARDSAPDVGAIER